MRRVAVVGSGIAGLAVAEALSGEARVTLYEAAARFGGHSHTVDVILEGRTHGVDTGVLVLNERTYPNLLQLFARLGVVCAPAEMSFSVQRTTPRGPALEWSGSDLDGVFAQRANLLRPAFWRMLAEIARFHRVANAAVAVDAFDGTETIGGFLARHRFAGLFRDAYFLPMVGSIWSCPTDRVLGFPVATMLRFCANHGLLQVRDRPQWFTVRGGSREYVRRMLRSIPDARASTPVRRVRRFEFSDGCDAVEVSTDAGTERFDALVLACHSDQALALLADADPAERSVLGAIGYGPNRAVLHTDTALLPVRRAAWAAWNHEAAATASGADGAVCLHYLLNRLQPLPFRTPVIVSLNPIRAPRAETVLGRFEYAHPVFDLAAIRAQAGVPGLQGRRRTWFCGAWTGHGFHEDGLVSGLAVVAGLRAAWSASAPPHRVGETA